MVGSNLPGRGGEFNGDEVRLARRYSVAGPATPLFVCELGDGPPVVVLHGGPGASHDYLLPSFGRLADEFRLCFYDQRGGGRSPVDRPSAIGWRDHVADLEALRIEWGLERLALAGYSWGGLLALLYATEYPDRVRALALVAPAAGWGDYQRRFKEEFERRNRSAAVQHLRAELESSDLRERDPAAYWQRRFDLSVAGYFRDPGQARGVTPFVVQARTQDATWRSLKGHGPRLRRKLRSLRVPTLVLHGRYDPIPLEWVEELCEVMPDAQLVALEGSGHLPYFDEPDRTFEELRNFFRKEAAS